MTLTMTLARRALTAVAACAAALTFAPAADASSRYADAVLGAGPLSYWRLGDAYESQQSGVSDATGRQLLAGTDNRQVWGHPGALAGDPDTSAWLPGLPINVYNTQDVSFRSWSWNNWPSPLEPFLFDGRKPFTLEAWIRPERLNTHTRRVFSVEGQALTDEGYVDGGYLLGVRSDGMVFSRYRGARWSTLNTPVAANQWQYVVATYDGATMKLYVNAQLRASGASTLAIPDRDTVHLSLGSKSGSYKFYAGGLDEAAMYTMTLPPERIALHYRLGTGQ